MRQFLLIFFAIVLFNLTSKAQNNTGTPYSMYGLGLLQDNYGAYTMMGGVSAAMRDNNNINFLNPASYTALDSNRFYFQFGINGEYVHISTHRETSNYRVAQNTSLNMAFRLFKNMYSSFGFNQRTDVGYDLYYYKPINNSDNQYYNQQISGEGGLNDFYLGLAYQFKNLSIGVNSSLVFGNLEKRVYLIPNVVDSYYINTRTKIHVTDVIFTMGAQYDINLKGNSRVTLGSAFNLGSTLNGKRDFEGYKVNSSTNDSEIFTSEVLNRGGISYPFKITGGAAYDYKNRWKLAGDYTFQKMSDYKEFGKKEEYDDYHKIALGFSWYPATRFGDIKWWQRNRYTIGGYGVRSHLYLRENYINTYAITFGAQMPFYVQGSSLLLGVAFDLGIRGIEKNGLIQEKYAKIRLNITFKEGWFMKRKIY